MLGLGVFTRFKVNLESFDMQLDVFRLIVQCLLRKLGEPLFVSEASLGPREHQVEL